MSPFLTKLTASLATAVIAFFVLRYGIRAALGENILCAIGGLVAGYAVWTKVAAWEIERALRALRGADQR